jgi:hypothetical protein
MTTIGYWEPVGDDIRVIQTADGYHAKVYADKCGWAGTVTTIATRKKRFSRSPYPTEDAAKAACQFVIAELRRFAEEDKKAQRTLPLEDTGPHI